MKIRYFILCFLLLAAHPARSQDQFTVLDWKAETSLRKHLIMEMHNLYDIRRDEVATALKTDSALMEYRERCRGKYLNLVGVLPAKGPLNPMVTKKMRRNGYSLENVIFESRPGIHVTANVYIPDGHGPFPSVLVLSGHEMTSKATESYQKTAILLAHNGLMAMVVDPFSQGERVQFVDSIGSRILRGSTTEHTLLNAGANLLGSAMVVWELYDNIRALDYLASRPETDKDRIGCLGNSGGGVQTTYLVAFDDRIKVAAPCSSVTRRERSYELTGTGDGCQQIPFEGRERLDISDFLILFAPKPLLILAGRYDFVDYYGTEEVCRELSSVYSLSGNREKVSMFTADDGHGISKPKREAAVEWFAFWLSNRNIDVTEPEITVSGERETWCTPTGQVVSYFNKEMTVQQANLMTAHELLSAREAFLHDKNVSDVQKKLVELLATGEPDTGVRTDVVSVEMHAGYSMKKLIIRKEGEVPLPCLYYIPSNEKSNDTIVISLSEKGKASQASDQELVSGYMRQGERLILADLRGTGETAEVPEANEWKYYNREYHNAIISLHTGKPLPGQRVTDILSLLKYLSDDPVTEGRPVKIVADGALALPALFTAVLSEQVKELDLHSSVKSYFEILERPMKEDWYSYVVPGVLKYFDLPDLIMLKSDLIVKYR